MPEGSQEAILKPLISDHKALNKQQTVVREALKGAAPHEQAIQLCLEQNAMLHSAIVTEMSFWSFEDEVLDDLPEEIFRRIPSSEEHSIVWCIWHLARIEDTALNYLVAGSSPVFEQDQWFELMEVPFRDAGNEMSAQEIARLSTEINLEALRAYRMAVGRRTQEIIANLTAEDIQQKVDPVRIQQVLEAGAIKPESRYITDYWGKRDTRGLLLMPATRHNIVHLNEAARLKKKR
jgi:hypothetical protein